jgi:hypothetical protein
MGAGAIIDCQHLIESSGGFPRDARHRRRNERLLSFLARSAKPLERRNTRKQK